MIYFKNIGVELFDWIEREIQIVTLIKIYVLETAHMKFTAQNN